MSAKGAALCGTLALNGLFVWFLMGAEFPRKVPTASPRSVIYVSIQATTEINPRADQPAPPPSIARKPSLKALRFTSPTFVVKPEVPSLVAETETVGQSPLVPLGPLVLAPSPTASAPLMLDDGVLRNAAKAGRSRGVSAMAEAAGVPLSTEKNVADDLSKSVQKAARADCRVAHTDKGLFALPFLAWDAATQKGCKW